MKAGAGGAAYPKTINTPARRALYDNLGKSEALALAVDAAVQASRQDEWRSNPFKVRRVRNAVVEALKQAGSQPGLSPHGATGHIAEPHGVYTTEPAPEFVQRVMDLVTNQHEY